MIGYVNPVYKGMWVAVVALVLTSCASIGLENPTAAELQAARCQDAQLAYNLSVVMLDPVIQGPMQSAEVAAYWEAYKRGAALGLITYCGQTEEAD